MGKTYTVHGDVPMAVPSEMRNRDFKTARRFGFAARLCEYV